jgi:hypothetical protein
LRRACEAFSQHTGRKAGAAFDRFDDFGFEQPQKRIGGLFQRDGGRRCRLAAIAPGLLGATASNERDVARLHGYAGIRRWRKGIELHETASLILVEFEPVVRRGRRALP